MKYISLIFILLCTVLISSPAVAADKAKDIGWEPEYVEALQAGKMPVIDEGGLPYTPDEETVLMDAIKKAMEKKAPPCQCATLAIELDYNPYMTLKYIYSFEGELDLDQLCTCATQKGVDKQVIAKAAMDAQREGKPAFQLDEVTQSNCLRSDEGLAYTLEDSPPDIIPPEPVPPPESRSVP